MKKWRSISVIFMICFICSACSVGSATSGRASDADIQGSENIERQNAESGKIDSDIEENDRSESGNIDSDIKGNDNAERGNIESDIKENDNAERGNIESDIKENDRSESGNIDSENFKNDNVENVSDEVMEELKLKIENMDISVEWEENESVEALRELVKDEPITISMSMYGGFEQVGFLGASLPQNDVPTTTSAGDIVLYSGNQMVVFYGSNSWSYTRLGKMIGKSDSEIAKLLGNGDVVITVYLSSEFDSDMSDKADNDKNIVKYLQR